MPNTHGSVLFTLSLSIILTLKERVIRNGVRKYTMIDQPIITFNKSNITRFPSRFTLSFWMTVKLFVKGKPAQEIAKKFTLGFFIPWVRIIFIL